MERDNLQAKRVRSLSKQRDAVGPRAVSLLTIALDRPTYSTRISIYNLVRRLSIDLLFS